jgi:hypothetical protein
MSLSEPLNSEPEDLSDEQDDPVAVGTVTVDDTPDAPAGTPAGTPVMSHEISEELHNRPTSFFVTLDEKKVHPKKSRSVVRKASLIPDSEIFMVDIDSYPKFYCKTKEEAVKKAICYLKMTKRDPDRKYHIRTFEDQVHLTSTYNFYIIQYESLEHVATITAIPQVQFHLNTF